MNINLNFNFLNKIRRKRGKTTPTPTLNNTKNKVSTQQKNKKTRQENNQLDPKTASINTSVKNYSKNNTTNNYHYYTAYDRKYFKTQKGKRPIKITATEAIQIVLLRKQGKTVEEIYNKVNWYHNHKMAIVDNWIKKYNLGLMDKSLFWICKRHVEDVATPVEQVLHRYIGDI